MNKQKAIAIAVRALKDYVDFFDFSSEHASEYMQALEVLTGNQYSLLHVPGPTKDTKSFHVVKS